MHRITVIETVERTYDVEDSGTEESARDRLHLWFRDPDTVAPGIVTLADVAEKRTGRRIKEAKKIGTPVAKVSD